MLFAHRPIGLLAGAFAATLTIAAPLPASAPAVVRVAANEAIDQIVTGAIAPAPATPAKGVVDFATEKQVVFDQAWGTLNRNFYDPKFHGQDWAALRTRWQPYVAGARNGAELRRIMNLMIGQLDASHSGMGAPQGSLPTDRVGNLGLRFDRARYEAGDGLVVREVVTHHATSD